MGARGKRGNFNILENFSYYVPGVADMFILLLFLLLGTVLGSILALPFSLIMGADRGTEFTMLVSYPIMFIPPMIYASVKSRSNSYLHDGVKLDSSHFAPVGGLICALLVAVGTIAMSFCADPLASLLPDMPEWLESALSSMTQGNVWVDFICVSIFAPFFEEWLCRGMVLRGLLHHDIKPVWAIVISAAFFAFIHLNPWQAIPAFLLGCLFGYVYYRTGSLKLTMLMHFANNTFALVLSNIDSMKDVENWNEILPAPVLWAVFAACAAIIVLVVLKFRNIPLQEKEGNSDKVQSLFSE